MILRKVKDKWAPLSAGFMLVAIFGFLISVWFIMDLSVSWGFTFSFFFVVMFIASFISMTKAEPVPVHMDTLSIHEHKKAYKPFLKKTVSEQKKGVRWYEPSLFLFFGLWLFYVFTYFNGTLDLTPGLLGLFFMVLTLLFLIYFVVDVFSRESLPTWEQVIFGIILIVTGGYGLVFFPIAGLGLLIYYVHLKLLPCN